MNESIAVLTYDCKHRKTYDTLCLLKAKGFCDVKVFAQSMTYQKKKFPIVNHRPGLLYDIPEIEELCNNLGFEYKYGDFEVISKNISTNTIYLLCGAGILPDSFIRNKKIINSHPGYIPLARGLDSFKWSLYYHYPIGVTTHLIGEYVDGGEIIERKVIDIEPYDTFHSLAQKVYENEINMLVNAITLVDNTHDFIKPEGELFRRMPKEIEEELIRMYKIGVNDR